MTSFGTRLYVADEGSGNIWLIDTTSNTATQFATFGPVPTDGLSVTPDGSRLYAVHPAGTGTGPGIVSVWNTATAALVTQVNVGDSPKSFGKFIVDVPTVSSTNAPVLIGVLATDTTHAVLIGRLDGSANADVTLDVFSAATCGASLLPAAQLPTPVTVHTDPNGYFFTDPQQPVNGIPTGAFASVRVAGGTTNSNCLVSSADNDSWPGALLVADSTPVSGYIDSPGKARWYKFDITPGQLVKVALTGLPADYDLAIFKDISQAFLSQLAATPADLTKLSAEFAPSVFSPSVFSPSVFSPSVFSPDAYSPSVFSPSVFSPSVFSPSVFSPSVFSPSVFSPSVFSPSVFSPSVFSPSVFSPSVFSPSVFSPSVFSPTEIAQAFSSAQTRSLLGVSATAGTGDEAVAANTWNDTGRFYVRVAGRGGAFSTNGTFTLQVDKGPTTCDGVDDTTLP
jgi:hypothetical protein